MTDSQSGSDAEMGANDQATPQAGILGNLPRSRPAVRSPRRPETPDPDPAADAARAAAESRPQAAEEPAEPEGQPPAQGNELEALARTGIAVATGAAGLGLRIAGRAAAAVRDAVERR